MIGIDLGTTNSVVAYLRAGQAEVIANSEGAKTTPSVVFYETLDTPLVGELAKRQLLLRPDRTVRSVKRLMGRRYSEAKDNLAKLPYPTRPSADDEIRILIDNGELSPEKVSCDILRKMRATAADFLGEESAQAVVTVPAHFNDSQRQATKHAAEQAGIEVLRIINEPTAAALAYGLRKQKAERVAVFDFGGGTFDISILELDEDVFEVRSTNGDTELGGDNIDELLSEAIAGWILKETGVDPGVDVGARQRIREAAEQAKCELSSLASTVVSLPFIVAGPRGPHHFSREIQRPEFEALVRPVLDRLKEPCARALSDGGLRRADIHSVILVGGSTRIPAVQQIVREFFGLEPNKSVNPDEAVALGAAIQAAVLSGEIEEVLLLDVTPLSLGIEVEGGVFRVLIPRNSSIPTAVKRRFTTTRDNQENVDVHALQGERSAAAENRSLAHLRLSGVAPSPAEVPEIEVSFAIDANGILSVSATDLTSGAQKEMIVESYRPAGEQEAERLAAEAEAQAEQDREFLRRVGRRQAALATQRAIAAFMESSGELITEEDGAALRQGLFRLDVAVHADNQEAVAETRAALLEIAQKYPEFLQAGRPSVEQVE
ncbi:MAG: molecular chaperone DnaK [Candidatus Sumerlaeota bacterium]|nr:molecular chaperone DnaK [Candidatus Sumerlaeota bacterium]